MALEKITEAQMNATGVVSSPDILNGTAAENKAVFDRMVRTLVAPAYNACVDAVNELEDTESGVAAAEEERIRAEAERKAAEEAREDKETGYVVRAETAATNAEKSEKAAAASAAAAKTSETNAAESERKAAQAMLGQIVDGSITAEKLATGAAAPAGYGYGEVLQEVNGYGVTEVELGVMLDAVLATMPNNTVKQIRFCGDSSYLDSSWHCAQLFKASNTYASLLSWSFLTQESAPIIKQKNNGVWYPFEHINPPMVPGVEYLTTERYNGKPVYAMCVDCGTVTDKQKITVNKSLTSNGAFGDFIRYFAIKATEPYEYFHDRDITHAYSRYVHAEKNGGNIEIVFYMGSSVSQTVDTFVTIYYT